MISLARFGAALTLVAALAGCAADPVWAPDSQVQAARYAPGGAPSISLITMISNNTGAGGHSALLIDGAERVMFDPSGSWRHPQVPERNDVLFGLRPQLLDFYYDYHARETYHVVVQELAVPAETAAFLSQQVQGYGAVPNAQCSLSISTVLSNTPGFENISRVWFPARLMEDFEQIPGVSTRRIYDDDSDDNLELLQTQAQAARSAEIAREVTGN
jgi:hypothetical protein